MIKHSGKEIEFTKNLAKMIMPKFNRTQEEKNKILPSKEKEDYFMKLLGSDAGENVSRKSKDTENSSSSNGKEEVKPKFKILTENSPDEKKTEYHYEKDKFVNGRRVEKVRTKLEKDEALKKIEEMTGEKPKESDSKKASEKATSKTVEKEDELHNNTGEEKINTWSHYDPDEEDWSNIDNTKEKKSDFNFENAVRARNKEALASMKDEFSQGTFLSNNASLIPDIKDPFYKDKLHHLKKKYLEEVSNKMKASGGYDYYKNITNNLDRAGAGSSETKEEMKKIIEREHNYAMQHAFDFINQNMDSVLAKHIRATRAGDMREKAKSYKDSIVENGGKFEVGQGKNISVKSIGESQAIRGVLDKMDSYSERNSDEKENNKVDNLSKLLRADKDKYIIR